MKSIDSSVSLEEGPRPQLAGGPGPHLDGSLGRPEPRTTYTVPGPLTHEVTAVINVGCSKLLSLW